MPIAYFAILLVLLLGALLLERVLHRRSREAIQHRIHVNGIRGKSSVTRLVAAGLRGGGYNAWAKVTGTLPNIVDGEGRELPIGRVNGANLSEQRTVFSLAARAGAEALVIECMAIRAQFQQIAEEGIVQATQAIITNVRPDHLEAYGDRLESVAFALAKTVPYRGTLFTTPGPAVQIFDRVARERGSSVVVVRPEEVEETEMALFSHIEHRENVALALRLCLHLGVDRNAALAAMQGARPDPGVLKIFEARRDGRILHVVNALAANDPASSLQLYRLFVEGRWACPVLVFVNTRRDRPLRSIQLGQLLAELPAARYFVAGDDIRSVISTAIEAGVEGERLIACRGMKPHSLAERLLDEARNEAALFAIGNTAAGGLETIDHLAAYEHEPGRP